MGRTYSFVDVTGTLIGPPGATIDLGYGSSNAKEGIDIEMGENKNTMTIGADGNGMHSLHAGKSGTITVRYLKVSPTNALLMALYDAQEAASALWGQNQIVIRQTLSGDTTTGLDGAFQKKSPIKYSEDGDVLIWVFDFIRIDTVLGTY